MARHRANRGLGSAFGSSVRRHFGAGIRIRDGASGLRSLWRCYFGGRLHGHSHRSPLPNSFLLHPTRNRGSRLHARSRQDTPHGYRLLVRNGTRHPRSVGLDGAHPGSRRSYRPWRALAALLLLSPSRDMPAVSAPDSGAGVGSPPSLLIGVGFRSDSRKSRKVTLKLLGAGGRGGGFTASARLAAVLGPRPPHYRCATQLR